MKRAKEGIDDEYADLAPSERLIREVPDLQLVDPAGEPTIEHLRELCAQAEEAALAAEGITNSEGADAGYGHSRVTLAATIAALSISPSRWPASNAFDAASLSQNRLTHAHSSPRPAVVALHTGLFTVRALPRDDLCRRKGPDASLNRLLDEHFAVIYRRRPPHLHKIIGRARRRVSPERKHGPVREPQAPPRIPGELAFPDTRRFFRPAS